MADGGIDRSYRVIKQIGDLAHSTVTNRRNVDRPAIESMPAAVTAFLGFP